MNVAVQIEWPWMKGQLDLWCLYKTSVSLGLTSQCYILSPNAIGLLVPEKKISKRFLHYMGMATILVM